MTIMDFHASLGEESTYATAVTPTRSFEVQADDWDLEKQFLESVGMRAGLQGVHYERVKAHDLGGTGSLQLDVLTGGFGLIFQGLAAGQSGPTQEASTDAYTSTFTATDAAPSTSYTVQIARPDIDGTVVPFTHTGAVVTGWSLTQDMDAFLRMALTYDYATLSTGESEATPAYPAGTVPFDWSECSITLDGSDVTNVMTLGLEATHAVKTNRRYLRGSTVKRMPLRNGVPELTGNMTADFVDGDFYDAFKAGTPLDDLVFTWEGTEIDTGHNYTLSIAMPKVQWRGETPKVSYSDTPTQNVPFKVLWDGSSPLFTVTYKTADTAL